MIFAGGRERALSRHFHIEGHPEIILDDVAHVLDNWVLRGIFPDDQGREGWRYYAFVPRVNRVVRVAVSLDDERVIIGFIDGQATKHLTQGNLTYFANKGRGIETRDDAESKL